VTSIFGVLGSQIDHSNSLFSLVVTSLFLSLGPPFERHQSCWITAHPNDLILTPRPHFNSITSVKTLLPNKVTFFGVGVKTLTRVF
jgi:hypothetical protein